ncbi:MAG: glycosyltransferase family 4 protein [Chloroflexota bacterium]|nr:glycosyltransferase family 4 protein [Chloroflexota bacterium]
MTMTIAYLSTDFGIPVYGNKGASIHVRELSSALAALGHDVEIVTCRTGGDAPAGFDIPVHEFPLAKPERLLVGAIQDDPYASEPMAKEVRSMLYASTLRYRLRELMETLSPDVIYERYSLLGTTGIDLAKDLAIPHILEVNSPLSGEQARHRGSALAQTIRAVERRVLGAADQIIAVSKPLKHWIVETGVEADRVTVVPNGVNIDRFASAAGDTRARLGLGDRPVIGFVGTLKGWHGTATLIRAVAMVARERGFDHAPHLLIVGDGPQRSRLAQVVIEEGVDALTTFTGMIAHEEMVAHIAAMDIAVAPYDETPDFYFSPLKLFEYMAAGRPVIAAGIGQIEDCIRHGETGLLYPPGDLQALTRCIADLLDDPVRAQSLGRAAREEAQAHRSWEHNARIVIDLVEHEQAHRRQLAARRTLHEGVS